MKTRLIGSVVSSAAVAGLLAGSVSAAPIAYDGFDTYPDGAVGNQGGWQLTRTDTSAAEGVIGTTGTNFVPGDNPFGTSGGKTIQHSPGVDSSLAFTPLAAGEDLFFSFNYISLDSSSTTTSGSQTYTFFNSDASLTPFMSLEFGPSDANGNRDLILKAQNNTQTLADAVTEDEAYFIYGKLATDATLNSWTFSVSIVDDIVDVEATEPATWDLSQTQVYGVSRASHADILSLDTAGSGSGRFITDDIRLASTYGEVAVPEPASLALLGMGGALVLGRRRSTDR